MIAFFKTIAYTPLYNIFVLILNISWIDAGIAAILLTVLVKVVLYPLSKKAVITQFKMKEKEGELAKIKEQYKDKQEQAVKVMEFYRTHGINPFSSIFTVLVQIPIIFSLYYIFFKSGLPEVDTELLYSFIKVPAEVSMLFLGFWDVSKQSIVLALLAAGSTFWQMHLSSQSPNANGKTDGEPKKEDFAQTMAKQMKYTMPVIVFFVSWKISGVVALYWFVSNLLGVAQDVYIKRKFFGTSSSKTNSPNLS